MLNDYYYYNMTDLNLFPPGDSQLLFEDDYYQKISFEGRDYSKRELKNREFAEVKFIKMNFEETHFNTVRFENCSFIACNLSLVKLKSCRFIDCRFDSCKIIGVNFMEADGSPVVKFNECKINYCIFYGMDIRRIGIINCEAREVNFENSDMTKASLRGSDLLDSIFRNTNLTGADLSQAVNYNINPEFNTIRKARFSMPEVMTLLQCFNIEIV